MPLGSLARIAVAGGTGARVATSSRMDGMEGPLEIRRARVKALGPNYADVRFGLAAVCSRVRRPARWSKHTYARVTMSRDAGLAGGL